MGAAGDASIIREVAQADRTLFRVLNGLGKKALKPRLVDGCQYNRFGNGSFTGLLGNEILKVTSRNQSRVKSNLPHASQHTEDIGLRLGDTVSVVISHRRETTSLQQQSCHLPA